MSLSSALARVSLYLGSVVGALFYPLLAFAQDPPSNPVAGAANLPKSAITFVSTREFMLTIALIAFGVIIIWVEYLLVRKRSNDKIEDLTKFFIVTLIIIGTLVLIGAGLNASEIAPVIGLFGTIAGLLLGRNERGQGQSNNPQDNQPNPNANPNPNPNPNQPNPNP